MYKEINGDVLFSAKIIHEGANAYIIRTNDNNVYKIYKRAFDNGENVLTVDDYKKRLEYIISCRDKIKGSILPKKILIYNGYLIGVEIEYFDDCITLREYLTSNHDIDLVRMKKDILNKLKELIDCGIVPTDPHFENILVREKNGQWEIFLIDLDDIDVLIFSDTDSQVFKESSTYVCHFVVDECFKQLKNGNTYS